MDWLIQLNVERFLTFTLVLVRISGLMIVAPVLGARQAPMQVRALIAFTLAILVAPTQWGVSVAYPGTMLNYLVFIGGELLIGICLGLGMVILFSAMQLAGQVIGQTSGMMAANIFDPMSGAQVSFFARLLYWVALGVYLCIGGHRYLMAALLDTFKSIPLGGAGIPPSLVDGFVELITLSFSLGMRVAMPVVMAILISTLILGLVGRTVPQLNILAVGFGLNNMLGFGVLALAIGTIMLTFQAQIEPTIMNVYNMLTQKF